MNKNDKIIVAILVLALGASFFYNWSKNKEYQEYLSEHPELLEKTEVATTETVAQEAKAESPAAQEVVAESTSSLVPLNSVTVKEPEVLLSVTNKVAIYTFTSYGAAIKNVTLLDYDKSLDKEEGNVVLDFATNPAMALKDANGLDVFDNFKLSANGNVVTAEAIRADGMKLVRKYEISDSDYVVKVSDSFENTTSNRLLLQELYVGLGGLSYESQEASSNFSYDVGVDARISPSTRDKDMDVEEYASKQFAEMFGGSGGGCSSVSVPANAKLSEKGDYAGKLDWITLRDRFFTQFLSPSKEGMKLRINCTRLPANGAFSLDNLYPSVCYGVETIEPGATFTNDYTYYAGPRMLSTLRNLGKDTVEIMRFGTWEIFCVWLLDFLNFIERNIPLGYGWAIIILTIIVRLVLYPINKKNAESMRKMQAVQPILKEISEKYKNDPQKRQQETMRVYGEHKVNPFASCLPMLIQLPVFVALFNVLRSSVELRFADFLWICDLSAPENLFADSLGFGINILPIAMAVTMALQSYLTPSGGDPQQRKMMMVMMPVMMLVMFYTLPSALTLYWTVSQVLAIIGMFIYNKRHPVTPIAANGSVEEIPPEAGIKVNKNKYRN